ncbi:hypothetical protein KBZ19_09220 [Synechococcus sp. L2F]|uniref:hypothetical protein n=1 Tax=Synechococcus sp. L2F TaxID=2823739 RepID=UPI0020CF4AE6|nr:hypothetical protein [Synechococcus sp. L2F]MCP9828665.1 hypothetical protein [Synechococcus sp. L2F]
MLNQVGRKERRPKPCRLCHAEKNLVEAHIIPRHFYHSIRNSGIGFGAGELVPRIYAAGSNRKPKQCQSGIFDSNMLCADCDQKVIGPWDKYAQELFLRSFPKQLATSMRIPAFYCVDSFDYSRLKLFFLSVLWRSAVTEQEFFDQVDIQGSEEKIRRMLLEGNPGASEEFPVMAVRYEGPFSEVMISPLRADIDEARIYHFRVPRYGWFHQTNDAPIGREIEFFRVRPNKPLLIKSTRYDSTPGLKNLLRLQRDGKIPE